MTESRDFRFDVAPDAARFVERLMRFGGADGDLVVTIAPQTEARVFELGEKAHEEIAQEIVKEALAEFHAVDSNAMKFHWVVGVSRRSRFPAEDILVCGGVPCFIPEEMKPILNGRALIVANDELRIEPEPQAPKRRP